MGLVILLAANVAHEVYSGQPARNYANSKLAELEGDDGDEGEYTPHDRDCIAAEPEDVWIGLVGLTRLAKWLKVPCLLSLFIKLAPPAQSHQNPNSKKVHVRKMKKRNLEENLPAGDILDDPKINSTQYDDDQEAEGLIVNEDPKDQIGDESQ